MTRSTGSALRRAFCTWPASTQPGRLEAACAKAAAARRHRSDPLYSMYVLAANHADEVTLVHPAAAETDGKNGSEHARPRLQQIRS
jgi:hypothetical protein